MGTPVLDLCRSREALRDERGRMREVLEETADNKRVTLERLKDSMERHALECLALPPASATGEVRYARIVPVQTRYRRVDGFDDVRSYIADVGRLVRDVPSTEVPSRVLEVVLGRLKVPDDRRRLSLTSTLPRSVQPTTEPPPEVRRLSTIVDGALSEYDGCRGMVRELRARVREATKSVQHVVPVERPVAVEMQRGGVRKVLHVSTEQRPPAPSRGLGVRRLSTILREAARHAVHDRDNFDARLTARVEELVRAATAPAPAPAPSDAARLLRVRVVASRGPGAAPPGAAGAQTNSSHQGE